MMERTFIESLIGEVRHQAGKGFDVSLTNTDKQNRFCLSGLMIRKSGEHCARSFYLDAQYRAYRSGKSVPQIAGEIILLCQPAVCPCRSEDLFAFSFQTVLKRVYFKLIHYQKNRTLLESVPHIRYLDLAIVFYCRNGAGPHGDDTILIHNQHMKAWAEAGPEVLCLHALKNTRKAMPAFIQILDDVMLNSTEGLLIGEYDDWDDVWPRGVIRRMADDYDRSQMHRFRDRSRMYLLSNEENLYGTASILYPNVLKRFADRLGVNLYLLPTSLHEMVIIPDNDMQNASELRQLVTDTNQAQVCPEEILSNEVYYYDRQEDMTLVI